MNVVETALPGVLLLEPAVHADHRGHFIETWSEDWRDALPEGTRFVRDGHTHNPRVGTVRGLHGQRGLGKLVHVTAGSALDVIVDVRPTSSSFGRHVALVLSAGEGRVVWVPPGFAHGYCTTAPDTVVAYRFTGGYVPGEEIGVRWDDPVLGIAWPVSGEEAILSDRDRNLPPLELLRA